MLGLGSIVSNIPIPEVIKKRVISYLLKRYVGQFLQKQLSLDQLTIEIISGTGIFRDLTLNVDALNETAEQINLPFKFVDGYISEICLSIPWKALLSENCFVEVSGLILTLHPKLRSEDVSVVDSMINSMTTSMQIAQECLSQVEAQDGTNLDDLYDDSMNCESNKPADFDPGLDSSGLERFALAIDTILSRIKVRFVDSIIRLENAPKNSITGIALEVRINKIDYFDEAGIDKESTTENNSERANLIGCDSFTSKKLLIEGITLYTDEFLNKSTDQHLNSFQNEPIHIHQNESKFDKDINTSIDLSNLNEKLMDNDHLENELDNSRKDSELILCSKLYGCQEIKIKLRQNDTVRGPKIQFEANCGSLMAFFSPRQIHLLWEFLDGFLFPEDKDNSYSVKIPEIESKQKPMNQNDFKTVEHELLKHLTPPDLIHSHALGQALKDGGWSSPPDIYADDKFLPMNCGISTELKNENRLISSFTSEMSELETSYSSSVAGNVIQGCNKSHTVNSNIKNENEIHMSFKVRFNSLGLAIVHEDILLPSSEQYETLAPSSIADMQVKTKEFFTCVGNIWHSDNSYREFTDLKDKLKDSCSLSHMRLIASPIIIEGIEKSLSNNWERNSSISIGWCELTENLFEEEGFSELISLLLGFKISEPQAHTNFALPTKPKAQIYINQTQSLSGTGKSRRPNIPKIEIRLSLDKCITEVDFSLVDRIATLLNKQKILQKTDEGFFSDLPPSHLDNQMFFKQIIDEDSMKPETKINIIISCPSLLLKLYFPIPDLRPLSDMNRVPWWKKNVRKEILHIDFEDVQFEILSSPSLKCDTYEIRCSDMHLLLQQNAESAPLSLARATVNKESEQGFDPVRIVCEVFPSVPMTALDDKPIKENIMSKSMMGFLEGVKGDAASLFGKRKVASQQNDKVNELTIPANKEEINKFIDNTLENVQIKLDINLPELQFILPCKYIYEILYNRIISDLFLWEPSSPSYAKAKSNLKLNLDQFSNFKICNFYQNDNDIDEPVSDFSTLQDTNIHNYVINEPLNGQTLASISLYIGNGIGSLKTPYRDAEGKILHDRHGEVMMSVKECLIFSAIGYKGNDDACSTAITATEFTLYHKANELTPPTQVLLNSSAPLSTLKLNPILYQSDHFNKMEGKTQSDDSNTEALIVCFESYFDTLKNEKNFILAAGLNNITLKYIMSFQSEYWISQLMDMFSVEDYPIEGYTLPDVVTEFYLNFNHCSIDYRPLNLNVKSFITIDSLSISSNLTLLGDSSVLLMIIEDGGLFLSQDFSTKKVLLKEKYVCVANIGVLEICIKVPFDSTESNAAQEFTISNNIVHIRTCADSCKMLMELLIYLANEGDLITEADLNRISSIENINESVILQPSESKEAIFSPTLGHASEVNQESIVENMMKEAMLESFPDKRTASLNGYDTLCNKKGVEVFLFPEENVKNKKLQKEISRASNVLHESFVPDTEMALSEALEDFSADKIVHKEIETDDEFCILDKVPGSGIRSPSGRAKFTSLLNEHLTVNENYFDISSANIIKKSHFDAPNFLPRAIMKYCLQDLSIIWYIYGGNDFTIDSEKPLKQNSDKNGNENHANKSALSSKNNFSRNQFKCVKSNSVSFSCGEANIIPEIINTSIINRSTSSPVLSRHCASIKWYTVGGHERQHDVLMELQLSKIKFQYDIYPETSKLVSKHTLTINDIEVRDRLVSSKINKFLYQFSSESCPRQAKANMVQIKALTTQMDPSSNSPETKLNISVRPIRLNIDQDALIFLTQFFGDLLSIDKMSEYGEEEMASQPKVQQQAPIMTVNMDNVSYISNGLPPIINENQEIKSNQDNSPVYFKSFVFSPDVPIRIDYHGKHVDINSEYGAVAGLIIGIGQLNHSEITLKRIEFLNGVLGTHKLITSVVNEWINDIRKNQLPSILGGVGPMHSFVKLFSGLKDLVWLPIEQYHKDGRVFRGLQRGTSSFTSSSAHAILDLSGRFVSCIQSAAETMYDMVSPGPSVRSKSYKMRSKQPQDIREGVATAFGLVRHGLGDTANTIWKVAAEEHSHKGVSGAVGGVLRQIPPSVVQPIILASEATCTVIGGMTNQLVPDARKEAAEKWKS